MRYLSAVRLSVTAALFFSVNCLAELFPRDLDGNVANGHEAVYDDALNITWLADANLALSNTFAVTGIGITGGMTFNTAQNYITAMNSANSGAGYLDINNWRLATVSPINTTSFDLAVSYDGSTDVGYQISAPIDPVYNQSGASAGATTNKLAYQYYNNLGAYGACSGVGNVDIYGCVPANEYGIDDATNVLNLALFSNIESSVYWSATETPTPGSYFALNFSSGTQAPLSFLSGAFVWPVFSGDIAAEPIPTDPNRFLTFFNAISPIYVEDTQTASAYYTAIDPGNTKTNLNDWLVENEFDSSVDASALYVNDLDLGFGRDMNIKTLADGRVVSFVRNHSDDTPGIDPVDGPPEEKVHNAYNGLNLIATVAMEYTYPPGNPTGEKYTTFYAFGPDGERILQADLDGRGAKSIPGACNTCHGGAPRPLLSDGSYPDFGDTGAGFLPWDLEALAFSAELFNGISSFTRADQESDFRLLNAAVLQTNPSDTVRELIEGWYGGPGLPSSTFDETFVPAGWAARPSTYLHAYAPNCRACHIMRNPASDFSTSDEFVNLLSRANTLTFDHGVMPMARRTYDRFWIDYNPVDPDYLDLFGAIPFERRPDAGVPVPFAGLDQPSLVGQTLQLNAALSLKANSFSWSIISAPAGSAATLLNSTTVNPTITPDLSGEYIFELTATNAEGSSTVQIKSLATSGVLTDIFSKTGAQFNTDIVTIIDTNCISCHTAPSNGGTAPPFDEPLRTTREEAIYRNLTMRSTAYQPEQSLLLLKSSQQISHGGGVVLAAGGIEYNRLKDWIAQGLYRQIDADDDGLDDRLEPTILTNPKLRDSDGDRYWDSVEIVKGTDPLNGSSYPGSPMKLNVDRGGWEGPGSGPYSVSFVSESGRYVEHCVGAIPGNGGFSCVTDLLSGKTIRLGSDNVAVAQQIDTDEFRYITFQSDLSSWIDDDFNAEWDIFLYDTLTETIERASESTAGPGGGIGGDDTSSNGSVTPDGRYVVFGSDAENLVDDDTNFLGDIFVKDMQTGVTSRANTSSAGVEAQFFESFKPSISDDGQFVLFTSDDTTLVANDTNGHTDVFVKNRTNNVLQRVNVDISGTQANGDTYFSTISGNGQFAVFYSAASNLVPNDFNSGVDVFVKDLQTGAIVRANVDSQEQEANAGGYSPSISSDGRFIAFLSSSDNLVPNDTNSAIDVFVRDMIDEVTVRVSVDALGQQANGNSLTPYISRDGHTITFATEATNLTADDSDLFTELVQVINPLFPIDTDGDGLTDAQEALFGTDINLIDSDGDGLTDLEEVFVNFSYKDYEVGVDYDPNNPDTDSDGLTDGQEVAAGFDPLNANSPGTYSVPSIPLIGFTGLALSLIGISLNRKRACSRYQ